MLDRRRRLGRVAPQISDSDLKRLMIRTPIWIPRAVDPLTDIVTADANAHPFPRGVSQALGVANRAWAETPDLRDYAVFVAAMVEVLDAAASLIAAPVWASLTYAFGSDSAQTLAVTDPVALEADRAQYSTGQGPCLDALRSGTLEPVVSDDLNTEQRWAGFTAATRAIDPNPRAVLSCPLRLPGDDRASLNLYAPTPGQWEQPALAELGGDAGLVVAAGVAVLLARRQAAHLQTALDSNRLIGAAVGILMARRQLTQSQAVDQLKSASQHLNRRIVEVAGDVVERGHLPVISRKR